MANLAKCCGVLALALPLAAQPGTCSGMTVGQLTSLNGFVPFPADNLWNADISAAPVDANSGNYINYIGATAPLHPDFGAGNDQGSSIGIPYPIVSGTQAKVAVKLKAYESDPGLEPLPPNALIEGYPRPGNGDRHVLVLARDGCWLYEVGKAYLTYGQWSADGAAIWDTMYIGGAPDSRWNNNDLSQLKTLTAADFEVVRLSALYTPGNVPTRPSPTIASFTANPATVSPGQPVTLSWSVSGSLYNIISPQAGPVRGTSLTVIPSATTTYQLYTRNQYGRTVASVTVTVH